MTAVPPAFARCFPLQVRRHATEPRPFLRTLQKSTSLFSLAFFVGACSSPGETPAPVAAHPTTPIASTALAQAPPASPPEPPRTTQLLITDRLALQAVQAAGHGLGMRLDGKDGSNAVLSKLPHFSTLVKAIETEVKSIERTDRRSGVGVGDKAHRLMDLRYLTANDATFDLIGVANRMDRAPLSSGCGEVRLAYRLSYSKAMSTGTFTSRLPATIILEYVVDNKGDDRCQTTAARWRAPAELSGKALGEWLVGPHGPLDPALFANHKLSAVNLNVQTVRWPSTVRPDLGGHAEYLLRSFQLDERGTLIPKPLENTPDVARIRSDPALRKALLAWLTNEENLQAIDAGTAILPQKFLATSAISVSPRGLARRNNRPFTQLFSASDLADVRLADRALVRSPRALLRRLDTLSCQGCHQSRSVAGFHLLGEDEPNPRSANAILVPFSPHVRDDIVRRREWVEATLKGESAVSVVPFPERGRGDGVRGSHCGLGDPGFAAWTCASGLSCIEEDSATDAVEVGVCLPDAAGEPGDACDVARVKPDDNAHRDRVEKVTRRACASYAVCERNEVGFPGGMCSTSCEAVASLADKRRGICGGIPILTGFNDCLARKIPFEQCIADNVRPAGLAACDSDMPCRDDYVCARTPSGKGACMPPYFLFQLRVDGHPPGEG